MTTGVHENDFSDGISAPLAGVFKRSATPFGEKGEAIDLTGTSRKFVGESRHAFMISGEKEGLGEESADEGECGYGLQ